MKYFYLFVFTLFFGFLSVSNEALAGRDSSFLRWVFTPVESEHDHHYLNGWDTAYDSDWENPWTPASWASDIQGAQGVIDGFYASGIMVEQYLDYEDRPMLKVGHRFLELSGRDQRRVVKFVAHVFNVDGYNHNGTMGIVYDPDDGACMPLGTYSRGQVQLH